MSLETTIINLSLDIISPKQRLNYSHHYHLLQYNKYGIKGLAWSMMIPRFDIINGVGLDYLHNTLLGVVKMLSKLWFNKAYIFVTYK